MRVLSLFAGIGGWDCGLERTGGFETVRFCEINPFSQRVLARHWPNVPCHGDIRTMEFKKGEADVITASFPCQDLSYAGGGAGLAGERSGLFWEVVRAVRLVGPELVLLENVAALLDRGMGRVVGAMASLGYDTESHCIPAGALGAPHRRDRIWIMAYPNGSRFQGCWANAERPRERPSWAGFSKEDWSEPHSDLYREPDGIRGRMDRLKATGNAVIPQIPEAIGRAIMAAERFNG